MSDDLGMILQRCTLPPAAKIDALEARMVPVQEVPPRDELRFYAVRGADRERLTSHAARKLLRDHGPPPKPVGEMTEVELIVEVASLRADVERMEPVYEAAKAWRADRAQIAGVLLTRDYDAADRLCAAVDTAAVKEAE